MPWWHDAAFSMPIKSRTHQLRAFVSALLALYGANAAAQLHRLVTNGFSRPFGGGPNRFAGAGQLLTPQLFAW